MASSLASGRLVQYITTCIVCLVFGFFRSWALTLVTLSVIPVMVILQIILQWIAGPLLAARDTQVVLAATLVERAVCAIGTVKAFNAVSQEQSAFSLVTQKLQDTAWRINRIWAVAYGLNKFISLGLLVPGFWFGAKLVRDGTVEAGHVMGVLWVCLIAAVNLQLCIPQLITLTKGKYVISGLLALIEAPNPGPSDVTIPGRPLISRSQLKRKAGSIRRIVPKRCSGDINLNQVTFSYPSRSSIPVLNKVTIYLPAFETTYIVGGSGSGKSTIAQLLLRMYDVQGGTIFLDDQDVRYLDTDWTRQQIGIVSQGVILFDMTIHDNVAMGLAGSGSKRRPQDVTRKEVVEACRTALLHRFIEDLPDGYDTRLGNGGTNLSGGQRQRLAIARAILRDPAVLILGEIQRIILKTFLLTFIQMKRHRH
jgi:ATP-binding cassette subfamily B (MDR/TAP) protein 1